MPTKTLQPALVLFLALTTACGPLVPLSYVKGRTDNQLTQSIETEDATVYMSYINSESNYYIFDLEIINRSPETLSMAPQRINMYASPNAFAEVKNPDDDIYKVSALNSALTMRRQFANSPATTRKVYYDRIKARRAAAGFFAVLAVGIIAYDAAK